jgi:hypothetical protein
VLLRLVVCCWGFLFSVGSVSDQMCGKEDYYLENFEGVSGYQGSALAEACVVEFTEELLQDYIPIIVGLPKFKITGIEGVNIPEIELLPPVTGKPPLIVASGLEGRVALARMCSIVKRYEGGKVLSRGYLGLPVKYSREITELSLRESALAISVGAASLYGSSFVEILGAIIVSNDEYTDDLGSKFSGRLFKSQATKKELNEKISLLKKTQKYHLNIPDRYSCVRK